MSVEQEIKQYCVQTYKELYKSEYAVYCQKPPLSPKRPI